MSNNTNSETLNFIELLSKFDKIEIPIIQRDYAQGRDGKEELRNNFLEALYNAVTTNNHIELDFVYGDVIQKVLRPLDGQQRLTTLFLLHWYIAKKENRLVKELENKLLKFTYETRISSREFCFDLITKGIDFNTLLETDYWEDDKNKPKHNQLSKTIENTHWYFLSWKKDPTIKSMLTMLDSIHLMFNVDTPIWDNLYNITFHFIELKGFGLSDDLYIKMNARGKPLTDFENFKAKFEQYINKVIYKTNQYGNIILENDQKVIVKDNWEINIGKFDTFAYKLDTSWTDLFWKFRDNEKQIFDEPFLNFFRTFAIFNYALKANEKHPEFRISIDLLRGNENISFNKYIQLNCIDFDYFENVKNVLNKLASKNGLVYYLNTNKYINENKVFKGIIRFLEINENKQIISNELSYPDLVIAYAYYKYLALEDTIDSVKLNDWLRIVHNLVEGSRPYLFNTVVEFANALRSIDNLLQHRNSITEYFATSETDSYSGFIKEQVLEEKLKAHLLLNDEQWKEEIINIEQHQYFNGQIEFLLNWCKIDDNTYDIEQFKVYINKAKAIFSENGLNEFNDYIFERALLATDNYLLKKGSNYSFLIDHERDISWKRLLRDNNEKRLVLKNLLDKLSINTINQDLQKIIEDFSFEEDWRYYFIKHPQLISACGKQKLIRWNNENDILLLGSTTTSGYHNEYYTYALYIELKTNENIANLYYQAQRSAEYWKYIKYLDYKFAFDANESQFFVINNDDWDNKNYFENKKQTIDFVKNVNN